MPSKHKKPSTAWTPLLLGWGRSGCALHNALHVDADVSAHHDRPMYVPMSILIPCRAVHPSVLHLPLRYPAVDLSIKLTVLWAAWGRTGRCTRQKRPAKAAFPILSRSAMSPLSLVPPLPWGYLCLETKSPKPVQTSFSRLWECVGGGRANHCRTEKTSSS